MGVIDTTRLLRLPSPPPPSRLFLSPLLSLSLSLSPVLAQEKLAGTGVGGRGGSSIGLSLIYHCHGTFLKPPSSLLCYLAEPRLYSMNLSPILSCGWRTPRADPSTRTPSRSPWSRSTSSSGWPRRTATSSGWSRRPKVNGNF